MEKFRIKMRLIALLFLGGCWNSVNCQINFPGGFTGSPNGGVTPNYYQSTISTFIQTNVCYCVGSGKCSLANGGGMINIRILNTPGIVGTSPTTSTSIASSGITPIIASQSSCASGLDLCCPQSGYSCGIQYSPYGGVPVTTTGTQSQYGSFPWQAVILTSSNVFVGTGVLIDHMHVLTVAHKISAYTSTSGQTLKVRMGVWDAQNANIYPTMEFPVTRVFVHPSYNPSTISNSIAILRLSPVVPLGQYPTITTACLSTTQISGMRCLVSGWGQNSFTSGSYQSVQNQVDLPLVDQNTCENQLRSTRLGSSFTLDRSSFMCAGGENGKDACTGDGGAPLVCAVSGLWYVVGLVAWGIGCGTTIPGVYINVTNYIGWIQSTTNSP